MKDARNDYNTQQRTAVGGSASGSSSRPPSHAHPFVPLDGSPSQDLLRGTPEAPGVRR